ncbi:hypothetical protein LUZ63_020700 [Rhynchospora breviuscula]|uniref:Radical S-adenosyl methionine domain-containing protein 1, mitochondrial n=1 Tax=Rhynchospora breviuscula TaxID=2022672 RepID=A0A9P9Z924_9POAL|nr:hypothetical protein LUZ63_020700 [Rhynchospora breviuscula]
MSAHDGQDRHDEHREGLEHDLPEMQERGMVRRTQVLARRGVLGLFAGLGVAAVAGCGSDGAGTTTSTSAGSGTRPAGGPGAVSQSGLDDGDIPEETAGPYPGDGSNGPDVLSQSGIVRSDITRSFGDASGVAEGVPLSIALRVYDNDGEEMTPYAGAAVYLWQCDAQGRYSLYDSEIEDENYLRGVQVADAEGRITFTSIVPACYDGRWPHLHFEVYGSVADATTASDRLRTSQIAFPEDVARTVYTTADGYDGSADNLEKVSLDSDMVFGDGHSLQLGKAWRVPGTPLDGEPVPDDGALPASSAAAVGRAPLAVYVHVPFCSVRCGYCDFNTYTAEELGGGASRSTYAAQAVAEVRMAARVLGDAAPPVSSVFVGGGTPTLLAAADLVEVLRAIDGELGLAPGAEVTTEANPDSVTPESLAALAEGGFDRVSFGMQSAVPHVLRVLDRTHDPERVPRTVEWAREAGIEQVSLDLIYGTPGESPDDWRRSLDAALACAPDHVSAYSLIVEDGTAMGRQVRRGELPEPDEDDLADKYLAADEALRAAGMSWYEVSNWSTSPRTRCEHNRTYWLGGDWWGVGPGAHSHVAGTRWWNRKHPAAYAARLAEGLSPGQGREVLDDADRHVERVLLEVRLAEGLPLAALDEAERARVPALVADGLAEPSDDAVVLTLRGRLLADAVVRRLLD